MESLDTRALLEATRKALVASEDGLDVPAVQLDTPLAALLFDSLMAMKFIATLEADLGVRDLPFEQWLAEHSEKMDALTIGSLIDWLLRLPALEDGVSAPVDAPGRRAEGA
jgi:acyl carrier protein